MKYIKSSIVLSFIMIIGLVSIVNGYQVVGGFQGWNNNIAAWNMHDNGTHGDLISGDGIWTLETTIASAAIHEWKIIVTPGDWGVTIPSGSNNWFQTTAANQIVRFYLDTNTNLAWSPSVNVAWTNRQPGHTYTAVGMQTWLGHHTDWDAAFSGATMNDSGIAGDEIAGDGIYTLRITFPTIDPATTGFKAIKVTLDNAWAKQIGWGQEYGGNWGFNSNGNQRAIVSFNSNDTIKLYADSIRGRLRMTQAYPPVAGPPWYAIGEVQGLLPTAATRINDSGINGDIIAGDGIYSRDFAVTFSLATHWTSIVDQTGARHPASSATKGLYYSALAGDTVKMLFSTNTALDGWLPFTRYAYTPAHIGTHTYTAVGNFQSEVGGSDWTPASLLTRMNDTGTAGDQSAGDNIFTYQGVIGSIVATLSNFEFKVALNDGWLMQIGGDGRSIEGSPGSYPFQALAGDTIRLEANVVTGRVRATNLNRSTNPLPSIIVSNGNPGDIRIFSVTGGNPPYIGWLSSDTSKVRIISFSGNTAIAQFMSFGSSTITVHDHLGQRSSAVASTVATSAPIAPDYLYYHRISYPMELKD